MNYSEAMEFIGSFTKSGAPVKDLSRARALMGSVGSPEKQLRFVHIAGTNGKGTTVEFISEILMAAGYTTGQFTSPYILRYNDRIRVNGREIPDEDVARLCSAVAGKIGDRSDFSQFEITMAIAMLYFLEMGCDIVVLEAGIGGRLDCTNVIPPPEVAVITSVSLDHTAILGDTIEKIAAQKAGIIKPGCDVVVGASVPVQAREIISKECARNNVKMSCGMAEPVHYRDEEGLKIAYGTETFSLKMNSHAAWANHRIAVEVCEKLRERGFAITDRNIHDGSARAKVIGRTEIIPGEPLVILDGGHNPEGVEGLKKAIILYAPEKSPVMTVVGMINSKDYQTCMRIVTEFSSQIFAVDDFAPNAVPAEKLAELAGDKCCAVHDLETAYKNAEAAAKAQKGIVVVCGSLYLVSAFAVSDMYKENAE